MPVKKLRKRSGFVIYKQLQRVQSSKLGTSKMYHLSIMVY